MKTNIFTAAIIAILLLLNINVFAAEYEIIDLGPGIALDINNEGQIVGGSRNKGTYSIYEPGARENPFLWDDGNRVEIFPEEGSAYAINELGQIAGAIGGKAFLWENNTMTFLEDAAADSSFAYDINSSGIIIGKCDSQLGYWTNGNFIDIPSMESSYSSSSGSSYTPYAISDNGIIVGKYSSFYIYYDPGGQHIVSSSYPWKFDIVNDVEQVHLYSSGKAVDIVGDAILGTIGATNVSHVLWQIGTTPYENDLLPTLGVPLGMNSQGVIVGTHQPIIGENGYAWVYKNGQIFDLNDLIPNDNMWVLNAAHAVNDNGQIVGHGVFEGTRHAFLLNIFRDYLSDPGTEFPVNYENYGIFSDQGTGAYTYEITNPVGLASAVGEGIYPNSESVLLNPRYQEYLSSGKLDGDVWNFVNSKDPWADYFKWATAVNVQLGEKLFYTALALENCRQFQHAIKAYKALIVHFPFTQAYNPYENIYWYPGIRAVDAITRLTTEHPEIGYEQINAKITVENGYDGNLEDDIFTASTGALAEYTLQNRIDRSAERLNSTDIEVRGTGRVKVIKRSDDSWQMRVDDKPFKVRGVTYSPTQVGMTADDQTAWQWLDTNDNGLIDAPEEAWVDSNKNNLRDADEFTYGDFKLLKDMGCNTIRFFHYAGADNKTYEPDEFNKELLRQLYYKYGIMVMMGDFFGGYTIGSGADWENGTDYTNPEHRAAMKEVVRQMVLDHKDEPYVLMWVLGNENNMAAEYNGINATRTNAAEEPQAYAEFLNEVALMIHEIDPDHPVAVGNLNLGLVEYYAQYAPELDIIATNHYTDRFGVGVSYLREAQEKIDRPLIISEYGADAYHQEQGVNELEQKTHLFGNWKAISYNGSTTPGEGNLLGGVIFEWTDEWWKAQSEYDFPWIQEIAPQFYWGIMPDHFAHEEWFGICSQGYGNQSPFLRQTRSSYALYSVIWSPASISERGYYVKISWDGYPGLTYTVECSEDNINWRDVESGIETSGYGRTSWIDNWTLTGSRASTFRRYYRVRIDGVSPAVYVLETFGGYNNIPQCSDDYIELGQNQSKQFTLIASDGDGDPLIYTIVNPPQHGILTGTAPNLIYTPDPFFVGEDSFSYKVFDGIDFSDEAIVNIKVNYVPVSGVAEFVAKDTTTQGNWKNSYGSDGYKIIADKEDYPTYAQVTSDVNKQWEWASSTEETRALQRIGSTDRIAACWYEMPSFDIDVNITDGQTHQISMYFLDGDSTARRQTVEIFDALTGVLLDSQVLDTSFHEGVYLVWNVSGSVSIRIKNPNGDNAVMSGLFFGGELENNVTFIKKDIETQGDWIGNYGADGYNVIGSSYSYPSFAQVSTDAKQFLWAESPSPLVDNSIAALQKPDNSGRIVSFWYDEWTFDIHVDITDGQVHQFAMYYLDKPSSPRSQTVEVLDAVNGMVLDNRAIQYFQSGIYWVWNIKGSVIFRIRKVGNDNAVVSGLFFGGSAEGILPSITAQPEDETVVEGQSAAFNISVTGSEVLTYQWYRNDVLIDGATTASYVIPTVALTDNGASFKVTITNDYGTITSNAALLNVNLADNTAAVFVKKDTITQGRWIGTYGADGYNLIGYKVSYPSYAQVSRTGSDQWIWSEETYSYSALAKVAGCWYGSPSHDIQVSITDGQTHNVAIYCLDWESSTRRQRIEIIDAVSKAVLDTQELNSEFRNGVYLSWNISGSVIIRVIQTGSDNAVVSGLFFGNSEVGIAPSITAQPQNATVPEGQSATFNVTASGSDPMIYQWYRNDIIIAGETSLSYTTPLTTLTDNGALFKVNVTNDYGTITSNAAVLTVNQAGSATALFVKRDTATQGNWLDVYGADGYEIASIISSYPAFAQVNSDANEYLYIYPPDDPIWDDVSLLQTLSGAGRFAPSCWYENGSFNLNLYINDEQTHQVAIYCLDADSTSRRQTIEVLDSVSGEVLDVQELSSPFNDGVYLVWNISGSVIIRATKTSGDNAVISGIFFGGSIAGIAPSITEQPEAMTVIEGQTVTFNITASGSNPLTYQWYKDDVIIDGAIADSYTISLAALIDDGASFKVTVINDYGTITSNAAVLNVNQVSNAAAVFVNTDTTTQGNWTGQYGSDGYNIIGDTMNYPSYAQVSNSGSGQWVWNSATTNISALEKAVGSERIAGCWYGSPSHDITVNITDGQTHQVAIYCLDWESSVRRQTVEVLDAASGAVLDSQEINDAFTNGVYLIWNISGSVIIRVTQTWLDNAVISGIFFD